MASQQALVDEGIVRPGSLFVGDHGFFARSVDSPRIEEIFQAVSVTDSILGGGVFREISAETPVVVLAVYGPHHLSDGNRMTLTDLVSDGASTES